MFRSNSIWRAARRSDGERAGANNVESGGGAARAKWEAAPKRLAPQMRLLTDGCETALALMRREVALNEPPNDSVVLPPLSPSPHSPPEEKNCVPLQSLPPLPHPPPRDKDPTPLPPLPPPLHSPPKNRVDVNLPSLPLPLHPPSDEVESEEEFMDDAFLAEVIKLAHIHECAHAESTHTHTPFVKI